jgi:ABC-type glycerol-3-phosphate transport system substrate-binding protein
MSKRIRIPVLAGIILSVVALMSVEAQQHAPVTRKTSYRLASWLNPESQTYVQLAVKAFQRDFPKVTVA